jgi:putative two-component system protein, hydrogenase maturation factor HypX/HoxX
VRILFLTRSFNSLTQRLYLELTTLGHEVAVEFDISDAVTIEAVALFQPALVIAPFLKRAIPETVWRRTVCLVVHPGIVGDRGPSALDWAISEGESEWGVTILQAESQMDAGPVWAAETFAMRDASKSSLYRNEVTEGAARAVVAAVQRFAAIGAAPAADTAQRRGRWRPLMQQADRRIDWQRDDTQTVLRKIRASDGTPGVLDQLFDTPCHLFDAHPEAQTDAGPPGHLIGRRHEAVLRATADGAVWIGHVRRADPPASFKLPTALAFPAQTAGLPDRNVAVDAPASPSGWREIWYAAEGDVGTLHFPFYNGAMSTAQCERLNAALRLALARPARVLVLFGGEDFWSNGIHLNVIEAADSPADESWRNINAIDNLTQTLIEATDRLIIAAMQGNAGAGGVFMALAADQVWARDGVVLNPHYKNMGNLYGSEYWTYLLPRRLKSMAPGGIMARRLPMSAAQAARSGLIDAVLGGSPQAFRAQVLQRAARLAAGADIPALLRAKRQQRERDEACKPLVAYRDEELARMRRNFYGFDPSYHVARSNFVQRVAPSWTPRHLAIHRNT